MFYCMLTLAYNVIIYKTKGICPGVDGYKKVTMEKERRNNENRITINFFVRVTNLTWRDV